jgi:predicted ester cyclase
MKGDVTMGTKENKALIRNFYERFDAGDLDATDEAFSASCALHYPGGVELVGPKGYKDNSAPFLSGLPDFEHIFEDMIAVDDKVVVRFTISATHTGDFAGIAPTGKKVSFTAIGIFQIRDEKIHEVWVEMDALGLMQQLGAIQ